jgi:hypothetical protein
MLSSTRMLPNSDERTEKSKPGSGCSSLTHFQFMRLETTEVDTLDETLLAPAGIARPDLPPLVRHAAGVHNEVFGLELA